MISSELSSASEDICDSSMLFWSTVARDRLSAIRTRASLRGEDATDDLRRTLNGELTAIRMAMCAVSTELNNLAPIFRIPPEIMSRILLILVTIDRPDLEPIPDKSAIAYSKRLRWIKATHVCRRWRHIALDTPELWRHVFLDLGVECAGEMAARAKSTPLCFTLDMYLPNIQDDIVSFLADHFLRTQHVRIRHGRQNSGPTPARYLLNQPAPLLESAEFKSFGATRNLSMNESLFDGCAPRLRHLSIYGCSFSWQSPILRHFISLTIERVAAIPLQTFVSAMQKLASMKVLVLKYCLPSLEDDIPPSSSPFSLVDFSNLAELTLCDNMDFVARFLARTRMSGETRLEITCLSLARNTNDIATFVTVLEHTGFFSLESTLPFTHIMHHPTDVEVEVRAWRAPSPNTFSTNGYQRKHTIADLVILFVGLEHDTQGEQDCPALMAAMHHAIPSEHLLEFEVHCNGWCGVNWTPHAWFDILGDAYNIRRVLIGGAFAPPFFSALSFPISDAETAAKSLFLPRLLSLDIGFVLRLHVPAEALLYDELLTALRVRKQSGVALRRLMQD